MQVDQVSSQNHEEEETKGGDQHYHAHYFEDEAEIEERKQALMRDF
jgi:hypothetical protein